MKIKVVELNEKGKVEFTKRELEQLLDEAYQDGYDRGYSNGKSYYGWTYGNGWWSSPTITTTTLGETITSTATNEESLLYVSSDDNSYSNKLKTDGTLNYK